MQAYFQTLFDYDFTTNKTMIRATQLANSPVKAVQLFAHLLAVQNIWLARCKNETTTVTLQPGWLIDSFYAINEENYHNWTNFLNNEQNFDRLITYKNFQGDIFTNTLTNSITQVINHGTHHRAQVGQQLKFAGAETLPVTDFIYYLRSLSK